MSAETPNFRVRPYREGSEPWQARADQLALDALPAVRAAAERWSAAIGGLMAAASVAALLKGPSAFNELGGWAGAAGRVCFLLAVVVAMAALVASALAAQPTPARLTLATGARLRELHESRFETAAAQLTFSRWAALGGVVLLATAAVLMWVGPRSTVAERPMVAARTSAGALLCGRLMSGGARLRVGTRQSSVMVRVDALSRLQVVNRCPAR